MQKAVLFDVDGQTYGFDISFVESIERQHAVTRLPGTADFVRGLMNLRGVIVPVLDGRRFFDRSPFQPEQQTRTIILERDGVRVGFMADGTRNVIDISPDMVQPVPADVEENSKIKLEGVIYVDTRVVGLLDVSPVLDSSMAVN
ncbi:chemotaxis protein CheW [Alicyclobacillus mengziensis]|uniref:Purine-binding chemotaxis protein CheW n=1 Tax=Alicyclobacillus mengziensis TaxID=2931921 RepID=A0A9X7VY87_9BACL|nr:chemotaxis protein CheW [Alicyclobacillus mengziensis]QSO47032.1 purine-binding chemotaxis protein CheW [Alicyclobacillus mengziensis]